MARGGARPGAGRKKGAITTKTREIAEAALGSGLTPLDYMLGILRDDQKPEAMRFEAAKAAAPFVHARLAAVDANVNHGGISINISPDDAEL
ncbi:hypothetical protein HNP47_000843 [Brevundimonas vesicularis]|uniref:Uncharacterized protein n=1 Tax=Brevundimonas vesicularis TaxID=41276 RepID=A0A7W9FSQ2_BREVE|nr:hypothetical protein [Brevundimonas vesicularis]MBB5770874.1 hypothetical protein [Brevundimonas vesicularis]